jgi:hypothetical protein
MDRFFGVEDPPAGGVPANPVEAESKAAGLVAAEPPMRRRRRRLPPPRSKALAATDADPVEPIGPIVFFTFFFVWEQYIYIYSFIYLFIYIYIYICKYIV